MIPIRLVLTSIVSGLVGATLAAAPDAVTKIRFDAPAAQFTESCPLGNGRLGAMMFGGVAEERIVLNETGMWSGSPQDADRPDAFKALPEIRRLLLAGKNAEAEALVNANFTCAGAGSGKGAGANVPYGCYQVLGNLRLKFTGVAADAPVKNYRRELDLATAIARVTYELDGVHYTREAFVSAPDQVIVVRLTADEKPALSFDVTLDRPENFQTTAVGGDSLLMTGQLPDGKGGATGVRYAARLHAKLPEGGEVSSTGNGLQIRNAREVVLLISAVTDMKSFAGRRSDDPVAATAADLERAEGWSRAKPWSMAELRAAHVADYAKYFDRVSLDLGPGGAAVEGKATPERLTAFAAGANDPAFVALYFNFGRYLLISSSRPGGLPANLQGLWAEEIQTPWNADWHLNINVQMNYWPAEVCNLSELARPLFDLIASLQQPGARTAQAYYNARGWVAHVITNPWGFTSPGEQASWGATSSGSAWLCQHLWEHYLFTGDRAFLAWAYPMLKGSAQFYLDTLIEEPAHHWLVTAPSNSPENSFYLPDGKVAHICLGSTSDEQLVRYLFGACAEAARVLGRDAGLSAELDAKRAQLAPTRIGSDGRVMEWLEEYREVDPHHRHVAHLLGLFPGNEITPERTPELAAAARKSLEARGDASTGWSVALKTGMWARLEDGDRAFRVLREQLKPVLAQSDRRWTGGTYPNLFDAHPPFQIDGNFGGTAVIAEMLLQSEPGEIHLLPALPKAWPQGAVRGLRARGGFEVAQTWREGRLISAQVQSAGGGKVRVRYGENSAEVVLKPGETARFDGELRRAD